MGIKHLKMLLLQLCKNSGINNFPTVNDFFANEKIRLYKKIIRDEKINNPIKQMQIKKSIETKPYFIGIDAFLYASRYKRVFKKIEFGFLRQIMLTLSSNMIPVYIFDGCAPEQKRKTIINRQAKKQKIRIKLENLLFSNAEDRPDFLSELTLDELVNHINNTYYKLDCIGIGENSSDNVVCNNSKDDFIVDIWDKNDSGVLLYDSTNKDSEYNEFVRLSKKSIGIEYDDIQNLKNFLDLLKIPYVTANREADDLMAYLYKNHIIHACQSDDMDMLPKGCGNVIQIANNSISQYILPDILKELGLSYHQFVDLCVLLGSDYYDTYLPKIKPMDLYNTYKQLHNPSLENFVELYSITDSKILSHLQAYQNARDSFLITAEDIDNQKIIQHLSPFSMNMIVEYFNNFGIYFSEQYDKKIRSMLKHVNKYIIFINQFVILC